jgi:hypothetical protein
MPLKTDKKTKSSWWIGIGFMTIAALSGVTYTLLHLETAGSGTDASTASSTPTSVHQSLSCITIATDPQPPLNVRSSPIVASDNIVGKVKNGTPLTVVDENEGWLRVSAPLDGWVYKELTVTSCTPSTSVNTTQAIATPVEPAGKEQQLLQKATEHYQSGQLDQAVALANSITPDQPTYADAQAILPVWQRDWRIAETKFISAQKALEQGKWQDVINQVSDFPENRFWRAKLAPLVKKAIQQQSAQTQSKR